MNPYLPPEVKQQLVKLKQFVKESVGKQQNLAYLTGDDDTYCSKVLNGYRFLNPERKQIWSSVLNCSPADFPNPPTFKKNDEVCPYFEFSGDGSGA